MEPVKRLFEKHPDTSVRNNLERYSLHIMKLHNFFDNVPIYESVFHWDNRGYAVVIFNWAIFVMELVPPCLIFKVSYTEFPVKLPIDEYSIHYNEQFGGSLIKSYASFPV